MNRLNRIALVPGVLLAVAVGCNRPVPPTSPEAAPLPALPAAPTAPVVPPQPPQGLTAKQLAGKTFIYNHQLLDGSLEGPSVVLAADGRLTGAGEQTGWRVDAGVLVFLDASDAVRTRFDKGYSGPAGLFFLGHRSADNKYHTLLELPPTK